MKFLFNCGVILFVFPFLFGCSSLGYQSPRYVKLAHQITAKTAKKLKEQKNLCLIGTGGGMMHDIQMMAMSFNYYQEVDLVQARELIVYANNEYLSDINNNQEIRPYLHDDPFTSKNVEIRIFIYGPDRLELPPEKIYCITSLNGILRYYTRSDHDHPICKETYEEALSEIASSQGSEAVGQKSHEEVIVTEAVAKDGAKVRISASSFKSSIFQLNGGGFQPYESLNFISNSCHEVLYFRINADENGNLPPVGLMPEVLGKTGGVCRIDILRKEAPIQIKLPWGIEALKD